MPGSSLLDLPSAEQFVRFREDFGQRFIVTVDTEEEFDWNAPLNRERFGLVTIPALRKFQQFCDGFGVVPSYMLDYPIASAPPAAEALRGAVADGRAEIGVQLHPWVSPPFEEAVNEFNSFAGNLPPRLENAKFARLRDAIEGNFGAAPLIYRAGRYGIGPHSAAMLKEHGLAIDTSVRALFDYSYAGGPNFRNHPLRPYWVDAERTLMELPLTTVYWGLLRQAGNIIYPHMWRTPSVRGLLARAGLLERIPLTPEGVTAEEAIRGVDIALDDGLPVLVFSFHSPSLAPGHTPYVRSDEDLDAFYDWWRTLFGYLASRGVRPTCVREIMASVALA
ncbi:polysaccharide deacetylase family protein [Novosphingobium album (ex Liu et al. 2023)]|uniref:Polysaccharide deacetylase family protein n=1 Tax=Novosphingobium album (ex Liu et al. 2023) TaxID=3031130 RepID=A0ABT5WPZ7_9SPHN|nr:polysaccharide deacetylase family protein [Novosphingobium album (ex Liu et al. 2023)]MDE8652120.1 polysaccharide deacetylase family protein [Novosphingobium album (ex Liu et al. 2023)]